jgi:S-adenosyl-L-methionine hydrolase (adenosine-forming)
MSSSIITSTTDFGNKDPFVGIMKGVILNINPRAVIIDLNHEIATQDVRGGAFSIFNSYRYFPKSTIHIVVIDPGVGSARRPIAVKTSDYIFIGPDNGVMSWAMIDNPPFIAHEITNSDFMLKEVSTTFHGRDIFAPTAAKLSQLSSKFNIFAKSNPWESLGPEVNSPVLIPFPKTKKIGQEIIGEILHIDRFGNLITNIRPNRSIKYLQLAIRGIDKIQIDGLSKTYDEVADGALILLVGSTNFLEIAKKGGNAAKALKVKVGEEIRVVFKTGS